jgi:hypothetical protein
LIEEFLVLLIGGDVLLVLELLGFERVENDLLVLDLLFFD